MERSLTLLLPVHNAQDSLTATVQRLLEVASELTDKFQLVVVDDGSTDATSEAAAELATEYPQVTLVRHGRRLGQAAAIRTGLRHSTGELVIVAHRATAASAEQVRRLYLAAVNDESHAGHDAPVAHRSGAGSKGPHAYKLLDRRKPNQTASHPMPARPNLASFVDPALAGR